MLHMIPNRHRIKFTKTALLVIIMTFSIPVKGAHLLVFGDSLSAAYGMQLEQGWVHLLDQAWGDKHTITNASISGETTTGGLARLPLALSEFKPDTVMIELGANDGLNGHPISRIHDNLSEMISLVKLTGAEVILASISIPASYGPRYIDQFRQNFHDLAELHNVPLIDLYREDFFTKPGYIQQDGIHPTAITQPIIRDTLLMFFENQGLFKQ